ncbi:MAG: hypothetical protein NVSMB62_02100 [Acidobacteriaceae bacterium]
MNTLTLARTVCSVGFPRLLAPAVLGACLLTAGCAEHAYGPPVPPVPYSGNALVVEADRRGFRAGADDGARDARNGTGYHPRRDRRYAEAPGYDPGLGPFALYRNTFRNAYLRGYADGFSGR